ncbi:GntR family transcriptional regulator [Arthrobacter sp. SD76]|uniref:GntR family transcriptional regulator n=1 Tax=Arthrobacter sp. SD76 TaxID=3415007 RepID=UPI003C722E65
MIHCPTVDHTCTMRRMVEQIKIVHSSTVQQVADGLTAMILSGGLKPGERLRESLLAENLGLSRNTVREAVRIVQAGGLIRHRANQEPSSGTPRTRKSWTSTTPATIWKPRPRGASPRARPSMRCTPPWRSSGQC